eukprot:369980-Prymnesium_polylepis.1
MEKGGQWPRGCSGSQLVARPRDQDPAAAPCRTKCANLWSPASSCCSRAHARRTSALICRLSCGGVSLERPTDGLHRRSVVGGAATSVHACVRRRRIALRRVVHAESRRAAADAGEPARSVQGLRLGQHAGRARWHGRRPGPALRRVVHQRPHPARQHIGRRAAADLWQRRAA